MTEKKSEKNNSAKKPLTLKHSGKLELKQSVDTGQVRQSFSHGRSRPVAVEVRRKRGVKRTVEAIDKENSKPDITPRPNKVAKVINEPKEDVNSE